MIMIFLFFIPAWICPRSHYDQSVTVFCEIKHCLSYHSGKVHDRGEYTGSAGRLSFFQSQFWDQQTSKNKHVRGSDRVESNIYFCL